MVLLIQIAHEIFWTSAFASEWRYFLFLNQLSVLTVWYRLSLFPEPVPNPRESWGFAKDNKTILCNSFNTES